jgi:hypothetical protein
MNQFKISHRLAFLVATFSIMLIAGAAMGLYGISLVSGERGCDLTQTQ